MGLAIVLISQAVGWVGFLIARNALQNRVELQLEAIATERRERLHAFVDRQHERVALVASRTQFRKLTAQFLKNEIPRDEFVNGTQRILRDANQSIDDFLEIWLVDLEGVAITGANDDRLGQDFSQTPEFTAGQSHSHQGAPKIVDGQYRAILSSPALDPQGNLLGVVMVSTRVAPLEKLLKDTTGLGETGEVVVGSIVGGKVEFLLPSRSGSTAEPTQNVPALVEAINGSEGSAASTFAGEEVLAWRIPVEYQPPEFRQWGLVAKIDSSEAYQPIVRLRNTLLWMQLAFLTSGLLLTYLLVQRMLSPVTQLAESVAEVAAGNLATRAPETTHDEVGALAVAFNRMTAELHRSYTTLEQRVAERTAELATSNEALEQSNIELKQFAYIASHDLQTPLRSVSGFAEFLKEDYYDQLDEQARDYIDRIVAGCVRMRTMIEELLTYSRVESRSVAFEPADLNEVVQRAIENLRPSIEDTAGAVVVDQLPTVQGDVSQLTQVFQNLIGNALKYRSEAPPHVRIAVDRVDDHWEVTVTDNGIGVPEKYFDTIFELFRRLHPNDKIPGTGIGLAICRRVVNRHGGKIWLTSNGDGATFHFTLPVLVDTAEMADS